METEDESTYARKAADIMASNRGQSFLSILFYAGAVLGIFMAGYLSGTIFTSGGAPTPAPTISAHDAHEYYTCSMHPQIRQDKPGNCPICGMELILKSGSPQSAVAGSDLPMSEEVIKLAEIEVAPVEKKMVEAEIRLIGKIDFDESKLKNITARFPGRLDRLFVDFTGIKIKAGEHLLEIYSPELLSAQQELLQAKKAVDDLPASEKGDLRRMAENSLAASREKLRLWNLTKEQIDQIENEKKPSDRVTIVAPMSGIVVKKEAVEGMYVNTGTPLYRIADLSRLWLKLDAYESDLQYLHFGQAVEFRVESYPAKMFHGVVSFISPLLNDATRTVELRVNVDNSEGLLKPEMFVHAVVKPLVGKNGIVQAISYTGKHICPMHPEVIKDAPGKCDICGMNLVEAEELGLSGKITPEPGLVIPATAPLLTGTRAVVYVRKEKDELGKKVPYFETREVQLAGRAGQYYIVQSGLQENEQVVVKGNFKIDASMQIQRMDSMMNAPTPAEQKSDEQKPPAETKTPVAEKVSVPVDFQKQLYQTALDYIALHSAFFNNSEKDTSVSVDKIKTSLEKVDMELLKGSAHMGWMVALKQIKSSLETISAGKDLKEKRAAFADLTAGLASALEQFGYSGEKKFYLLECSMANDGKGASWIQDDDQTRNPYFGTGSPMAGCSTAMKEIAQQK